VQRLLKGKIVSIYVLWEQTPKTLSVMGIKVPDILKLRALTVLPE
jgi:hypothetical protein